MSRVLQLDATPRHLEGLRRACSSTRRHLKAIPYRCRNCGARFFGSKLTAHICPECEDTQVLEDAS